MTTRAVRHRVALILGADNPVGRACALQFSRSGAGVLIAGFNRHKLALLGRLIEDKKGDPLEAAITMDHDKSLSNLVTQRDAFGHVHYIVNAAAFDGEAEGEGQNPLARAHHCHELAKSLAAGRGAVRFITIWPDDAGDPPHHAAEAWHSLVRVDTVEAEGSGEAAPGDTVRAAAVGDTLVHLSNCPPGCCPVEVRLAARQLKA